MEHDNDDVQQPPPQQPGVNRVVKLPPFWPGNAAAWFTAAEGNFELRGIAEERPKFFNCLNALPEASVILIADLVEANPLPDNCYTQLRARLLNAHQLTDIQRVEQLINLPPLAAQKPSELLAEMIRLCPRGQENNVFFNTLFLSKLPRDLRTHMSGVPMADKQVVAAQVDQLWAHNSRLYHDAAVAAVAATPGKELTSGDETQEDGAVAAVGAGGRNRGGGKGGRGNASGRGRGGGREDKAGKTGKSGLCNKHYHYGAGAYRCDAPSTCQWPGN